jgi:hypothetical protein
MDAWLAQDGWFGEELFGRGAEVGEGSHAVQSIEVALYAVL